MNDVGAFISGSGGGHPAAAGANGPNVDKVKQALELAVRLARDQLKEAAISKIAKKK
jgi:nanoRNase/pAp phosphatase (c-di-AMP/oligoRNAs hydrolase)